MFAAFALYTLTALAVEGGADVYLERATEAAAAGDLSLPRCVDSSPTR